MRRLEWCKAFGRVVFRWDDWEEGKWAATSDPQRKLIRDLLGDEATLEDATRLPDADDSSTPAGRWVIAEAQSLLGSVEEATAALGDEERFWRIMGRAALSGWGVDPEKVQDRP
jgi:hypothetical protein